MPTTTTWHRDFWSLLPINIGKGSVVTTWLSHIRSTKGIGTSRGAVPGILVARWRHSTGTADTAPPLTCVQHRVGRRCTPGPVFPWHG